MLVLNTYPHIYTYNIRGKYYKILWLIEYIIDNPNSI